MKALRLSLLLVFVLFQNSLFSQNLNRWYFVTKDISIDGIEIQSNNYVYGRLNTKEKKLEVKIGSLLANGKFRYVNIPISYIDLTKKEPKIAMDSALNLNSFKITYDSLGQVYLTCEIKDKKEFEDLGTVTVTLLDSQNRSVFPAFKLMKDTGAGKRAIFMIGSLNKVFLESFLRVRNFRILSTGQSRFISIFAFEMMCENLSDDSFELKINLAERKFGDDSGVAHYAFTVDRSDAPQCIIVFSSGSPKIVMNKWTVQDAITFGNDNTLNMDLMAVWDNRIALVTVSKVLDVEIVLMGLSIWIWLFIVLLTVAVIAVSVIYRIGRKRAHVTEEIKQDPEPVFKGAQKKEKPVKKKEEQIAPEDSKAEKDADTTAQLRIDDSNSNEPEASSNKDDDVSVNPEKRIDKLQADIDEMNRQIVQLNEVKRTLEEANQNSEQEIKSKSEKIEDLEKELKKNEDSIKELKEKKNKLDGKLDKLQKENEDIKVDLKNKDTEFKKLKSDYENLSNEHNVLSRDFLAIDAMESASLSEDIRSLYDADQMIVETIGKIEKYHKNIVDESSPHYRYVKETYTELKLTFVSSERLRAVIQGLKDLQSKARTPNNTLMGLVPKAGEGINVSADIIRTAVRKFVKEEVCLQLVGPLLIAIERLCVSNDTGEVESESAFKTVVETLKQQRGKIDTFLNSVGLRSLPGFCLFYDIGADENKIKKYIDAVGSRKTKNIFPLSNKPNKEFIIDIKAWPFLDQEAGGAIFNGPKVAVWISEL